jgi:hypothetical protein
LSDIVIEVKKKWSEQWKGLGFFTETSLERVELPICD